MQDESKQDLSQSNLGNEYQPPQTSYKKKRGAQNTRTAPKTSHLPKRNLSHSKPKPKGSMFNSRGGYTTNPGFNKSSKIRKYSHNRPYMAKPKTKGRPGTNYTSSRVNQTHYTNTSGHMNQSFSHKQHRVMSNKSKLSQSKRSMSKTKHSESAKPRLANEGEKEQEILITKTYDLSLNIHKKTNNKKISYVNKDTQECTFTVKSSHPDQLSFKNNAIMVGGGEKAKFGLKFENVEEPKLAQYVLFLSKNGQPHENILLNVKYE